MASPGFLSSILQSLFCHGLRPDISSSSSQSTVFLKKSRPKSMGQKYWDNGNIGILERFAKQNNPAHTINLVSVRGVSNSAIPTIPRIYRLFLYFYIFSIRHIERICVSSIVKERVQNGREFYLRESF